MSRKWAVSTEMYERYKTSKLLGLTEFSIPLPSPSAHEVHVVLNLDIERIELEYESATRTYHVKVRN